MPISDRMKKLRRDLQSASPDVRARFSEKVFDSNLGGSKRKTTDELGMLGLSRKEIKKGRRRTFL